MSQISNVQPSTTATTFSQVTSKASEKETEKESVNYETTYVPTAKDTANYKVDMEKVKAMKAETDQKMIDLITKSTSKGLLKQLGGLRGVIEKLINGEIVDSDFEVTPESIQKAKADVSEGGYWSPEKTSDRFLAFAQALSGGDPSKANLLMDAFKEGYKQAEEIWGGKLPEISKKTYALTLEKFEAWAQSTSAE